MPDLHYLDFDTCDGADGVTTWDAMACVRAEHVTQWLAEVQALLRWAHSQFGPALPLDEGGTWDVDLQAQDDAGQPVAIQGDAHNGTLTVDAASDGRTTLVLTLTGSEAFAQALRETWGVG